MTISMCFFSSLLAQDTTTNAPKASTSQATDSDCTKELLLSYFPQNFVKETLKKFNVPEGKWDAIAQALSDKNKDVVKLVEEKAAQSNPNPLKDPSLHQQAVAIFRDTLLQVFSDIAKANGISDDNQIKQMFVDIQQQKAKRFVECRRKAEEAAGGQAGNKDSDEDDNDDEDDDDNDDDEDDNDSTPKPQEKDGDDDEDADDDIKLPKPDVPDNERMPHGYYHEDRFQQQQRMQQGQGRMNADYGQQQFEQQQMNSDNRFIQQYPQ